MKSFWEESYNGAKDQHYGFLFFATLLVFIGAVIVGMISYEIAGADNFRHFVLPVSLGIGAFIFVSSWWCICRAWKRRKEQLKFAALSRDELAKARSKLRNNVKPTRPVPMRAPDTDLKY